MPFAIAVFFSSCFRPKPDMPDFKLMLLDSTTILNTRDIPTGKPSLLLFFDPYCDYCQKETIDITKHMDSMKNVNFYFITIDSFRLMWAFNGYFGLYKYPNITVGRDFTYSFPAKFPKVTPPYAVLYDKYKRARVVIPGRVDASKIISFIQQL